MATHRAWLVLILLAAAFLRLHALDEAPPGLTHDEADHGLDAWGIVEGARPIYMTVGFGREPLFDYGTAALMRFLGPTYLAGRLAAAFTSLLLVATSFAWTRNAFGRSTALLAAAGLATGFWPVMTGRQVLRSITLPAVFVPALFFFWQALRHSMATGNARSHDRLRVLFHKPGRYYVAAGLLLGLSLYTYFPARILWILFPISAVLLAGRRLRFIWHWPALTAMIGLGLALPLYRFLATHPGAEARLDELSLSLRLAAGGDFSLLTENTIAGLGMLAIQGDGAWRYNIAGRPLLGPIMGLLFFLGLAIAVWRLVQWLRAGDKTQSGRGSQRAAAIIVTLSWLLLGLSPALITGRDLSTPRIIGLQPVLYLFPALALVALGRRASLPRRIQPLIPLVLFTALMAMTARSYFVDWANEPEVRVQYETSLVTSIRYLNEYGTGTVAVSTSTPGPFHSPAVALLTLENPDVELTWFNGAHSLLLPQGDPASVIFSGFAPLVGQLEPYLLAEFTEEIPSRPTDLDRPISLYRVNATATVHYWDTQLDRKIDEPAGVSLPLQFGQAAEFLGYALQAPLVSAGQEIGLVTHWQAIQPLDDAVLFTHLLGPEGVPLAQDDRLDVPSAGWRPGDRFLQLHRFLLPTDMQPGDYPLAIGLYKRADLSRLSVMMGDTAIGDQVILGTIQVRP